MWAHDSATCRVVGSKRACRTARGATRRDNERAARLAALRAAVDAASAGMDAGLRVETTPEELMADAFAEQTKATSSFTSS